MQPSVTVDGFKPSTVNWSPNNSRMSSQPSQATYSSRNRPNLELPTHPRIVPSLQSSNKKGKAPVRPQTGHQSPSPLLLPTLQPPPPHDQSHDTFKSDLPPHSQSQSQSQSWASSKQPHPTPQPPPQIPPVSSIDLRPNRFFGPPSTYRSYIESERTVAQSLEYERAQDLSIHLYNAYVLRHKAELAGNFGRGSRSRSRSQSLSVSARSSQSRSRSRGRKGARSRDKGKGRADSGHSASPAIANGQGVEGVIESMGGEVTFNPPRFWTAWPLPPSEVPREEFLPLMVLGGGGYRRQRDPRPRADLEECLIAVTTRFAKERWEAREWESNDDSEKEERRQRTKRRKESNVNHNDTDLELQSSVDVSMRDEEGQTTDNTAESPASTNSVASGPEIEGIQFFSSQVFAATSPSDSSTSESVPDPSPVFLADDGRIRQLLLPSTRHITSQLDDLLSALHKMQCNRRGKVVDIAGRGPEEVFALAPLFFEKEVVERAQRRCDALLNLAD